MLTSGDGPASVLNPSSQIFKSFQRRAPKKCPPVPPLELPSQLGSKKNAAAVGKSSSSKNPKRDRLNKRLDPDARMTALRNRLRGPSSKNVPTGEADIQIWHEGPGDIRRHDSIGTEDLCG
jgi:hypothetical protein